MGKLAEMQERHPAIGQVRGKGLMVGVEFVRDRETRERAKEMRDAVVDFAFEEKLLLLGCGINTLRIIPPLNVTAREIEDAMLILEHCIGHVEELYL
jgi:4-aminobutyrate aminotransferase